MKKISKIGVGIFLICIIVTGIGKVPDVIGKADSYTVVFSANGGSGSMSSQKIERDKKVALKKCTFHRKGYSFQGWAKSKKGNVVYRNKAKVKNIVKAGKKVKLYAIWKKEGKRRALILGETSTDAVPIQDVKSMKAMMNTCTFYGKKMDSIVAYPNHTKKEITSKIKKTFYETTEKDVSYIYMTCHGDETGKIIIGSDGKSYSTAELRKLLDKSTKGKVVLLLDCCFSGNAVTKQEVSEDENFAEKFVEEFFSINDVENEKGGELAVAKYRILCSSKKNEVSYGGSYSVATKYWELGAGWKEEENEKCNMHADKNKDKKITLQELYTYSYKKVIEEAPKQHIVVYPKKSSFVIFGRFQ